MRTNRLMALAAAAAIAVAPLAAGTAMADPNDNANENAGANSNKPVDKPVKPAKKVGLTKLAFVGASFDETLGKWVVPVGTASVKVLAQVKGSVKDVKAGNVDVALTGAPEGTEPTAVALTRKGKGKKVANLQGAFDTSQASLEQEYCLLADSVSLIYKDDSSAIVTEQSLNASSKKLCFTVVAAPVS